MRLTVEQREAIWQRDRHRCQWTGCPLPGSQVAHCHSRGMGGKPSANDPANLILLCHMHALMSDGEHWSGGAGEYRVEHERLLGVRVFADMSRRVLAWERAEALTQLVSRRGIL